MTIETGKFAEVISYNGGDREGEREEKWRGGGGGGREGGRVGGRDRISVPVQCPHTPAKMSSMALMLLASGVSIS